MWGRLVVVDCVRRFGWVPWTPLTLRALACARLPMLVAERGWRTAWNIFRFETSGPWLRHSLTDRYLSPAEFRTAYGAVLPGARFKPMGGFMGVAWQANGPTSGG